MSFTKVKKLSPWRKLALVTWQRPADPSVYSYYEFDATNALEFIEQYNQKNDVKTNITHFMAKAMGLTLVQYPALNGIIKWGTIYKRNSIDIFLQVAIEDKQNKQNESLSGAKINNIDKKSLKEIATELKQKASNIRNDKDPQFQQTFETAKKLPIWLLKFLVKVHEFAVYNLNLNIPSLGVVPDPFGSAMLTSVGSLGTPPGFAPLVPPSRCPFLICLGRIDKKPWVVSDKVKVRPIAALTATFDHRFIDGLVGSKMFKTFTDILENPNNYLE